MYKPYSFFREVFHVVFSLQIILFISHKTSVIVNAKINLLFCCFHDSGALEAVQRAADEYGFNDNGFAMDDVRCTGMESGLSECDFPEWRSHNCDKGEEVAGVRCQPERTSPNRGKAMWQCQAHSFTCIVTPPDRPQTGELPFEIKPVHLLRDSHC